MLRITRWTSLCSLVLAQLLTSVTASSHGFQPQQDLHLIGFDVGSPLAMFPDQARRQGFELSDGTYQTFDRWYRTTFPEIRVDFLYVVEPDFALIFGLGSGQYGEKFQIDPSFNIGFIRQVDVGENGTLSLRLTTRLGGELREKPCIANYGDIGGVQRVNCRLAATPLPPKDTLSFLWREKPEDRIRASINLVFRF